MNGRWMMIVLLWPVAPLLMVWWLVSEAIREQKEVE